MGPQVPLASMEIVTMPPAAALVEVVASVEAESYANVSAVNAVLASIVGPCLRKARDVNGVILA